MTTPRSDELLIPMEVGGAPASPNGAIPARPGQRVVLRARLRSEYVAGTGYAWYAQYLRALPFAIDDVTADFGDDIYERMLLDAQIASDVLRMKAAILEDGVRLTPAVKEEGEDGYELARTIAETLQHILDEMETSIDDVLFNLLDALMLGSRVAEQVYAYQPVAGRRLLTLSALRVKPRRTTSFVVDAYARVIGLLGILPSGYSPVMVGSVLSDLAEQPNLIPREKFAVLTWRPRDADPRGTSIGRPAYRPWWLKQQIVGDYLKYLTQFASPSMIGFTPADAQDRPATDALGNPVLDANNNPVLVTPEQQMLTTLEQWANSGAAAFRGGPNSDVKLVQSQGNGSAFLNALLFCNREMGKALTTQSLATEEGQHDARAAATVHQDALDTLIRQGKRGVERMLRFDILRPLVRYNWGEEAMRTLVPRVSLGQVEEHDFKSEGETVARLYAVGYLGESQKQAIDERLGLPVRDPAYDRAHASIITSTRPEPVKPVEGMAPESEAAATAGLIEEAGHKPQQVQN